MPPHADELRADGVVLREVVVPEVVVRDAVDGDWPDVYPVFRAVVAGGRTYTYPDGLSSEEARALWMAPAPVRTVVAVDGGGTVLGTARMGPNRPGRGSHVATAAFMVHPDHHGGGIGRRLGLEALAWARDAGYRSMQFNAVVETNQAAVHLWQSLGFEILATVPEAFDHPDHGFVGLHVMYRRLAGDGLPPAS